MTTSDQGDQLRLDGINANLAAVTPPHRPYRWHAERAISELAATGQEFVSDDVHRRIPPNVRPHHPNVLPSLMNCACRNHSIRKCGYRESTRPSRHSGLVRVWKGTQQ